MSVGYLANLSLYIPELLCVATMVGLLFLEASRNEKEEGMKAFFACAFIGLIFALMAGMAIHLSTRPIRTLATLTDQGKNDHFNIN